VSRIVAQTSLMHPGVGRADAAPGTPDWAQHHMLSLVSDVNHVADDLRHFARHLDVIASAEGWRLMKRKDGGAFATAHEWVEAPKPFGLGTPVAELLRRLDLVAEGKAFKAILRNGEPSPRVFVGQALPMADGHEKPWPRPKDDAFVAPSVHPAANLFPMLNEAALADLAADIAANGQREPVVLWEGKVIDGRNRLAACERAGVVPCFTALTHCPDPVAYVMSANLHRRHLTEAQRVALAVKILPSLEQAAAERQKALAGSRPNAGADLPANRQEGAGESVEHAAALTQTAPRSVARAAAVHREGVPELFDAMARGEVAISSAADLATLPKDEQQALVSAGKAAMRDKAKAIREAKPTKKNKAPGDYEAMVATVAEAKDAKTLDNLSGRLGKLKLTSKQIERIAALIQDRHAELKADLVVENRSPYRGKDGLRRAMSEAMAGFPNLNAEDQAYFIDGLIVAVTDGDKRCWAQMLLDRLQSRA